MDEGSSAVPMPAAQPQVAAGHCGKCGAPYFHNDGSRARNREDDWDGTDADHWAERSKFRDRRVYRQRIRAFYDEDVQLPH